MDLIYRDGTGQMHTVPLAGRDKVTIGRDASRDVAFEDARISRLHATIEAVSGTFLLRDAGSSNGTFLNGLRLGAASAVLLREGDVIEIGSALLLVGNARDYDRHRPSSGVVTESAVPVADLLHDGWYALRSHGGSSPGGAAILATLATIPDPHALEATLRTVKTLLTVQGIAVFVEAAGALAARASSSPNAAARLTAIAGRAHATQEGRVYQERRPEKAGASGETLADLTEASAAVPFVGADRRTRGVLGVERGTGPIDRQDLALVAILGEWIVRSLGTGG